MKTILGFLAPQEMEIPKLFFESLPETSFQKTIFKMRIFGFDENCCLANDIYVILKKLSLLIML
jgi:hypothetical protein